MCIMGVEGHVTHRVLYAVLYVALYVALYAAPYSGGRGWRAVSCAPCAGGREGRAVRGVGAAMCRVLLVHEMCVMYAGGYAPCAALYAGGGGG